MCAAAAVVCKWRVGFISAVLWRHVSQQHAADYVVFQQHEKFYLILFYNIRLNIAILLYWRVSDDVTNQRVLII